MNKYWNCDSDIKITAAVMKLAGYVVWILLCKVQMFGSNSYCHCWYTEVFLGDCFFIGAPCRASFITLAENFDKWRPYLELFFGGGHRGGRGQKFHWKPRPPTPLPLGTAPVCKLVYFWFNVVIYRQFVLWQIFFWHHCSFSSTNVSFDLNA